MILLKLVNCLGNLLLISDSHNASIGNKPFADKNKLKTYKENKVLKQQVEIVDFLDEKRKKPKWDSQAIKRRHKKILEFALNRWNFDE